MSNILNMQAKDLRYFVETIIQQKLATTTQYEAIKTGTIISSSGSSYNVQITGSVENPISATVINNKELNLMTNDGVYLVTVNNSGFIEHLILDKIEVVNQKTFALTLDDRFIGVKEWTGETNKENTIITYKDDDALNIIKETGVFKVTLQNTSHGVGDSNYGIIITLYNNEEEEIKSFTFDTHSFIGQPFNCKELDQSKVFFIEEDSLKDVNLFKIEIKYFSGDLFVTDPEEDTREIINIQLYTGDLIEINAYLRVDTVIEEGKDYFSQTAPSEEVIQLKANLYSNLNKITDNRIRYYWLVKNEAVINKDNPGYLDIKGAGARWYCLNKVDEVEIANGAKIKIWDAINNTIELKASEYKNIFRVYENKVKCLVVYGDNIVISKTFNIYNFANERFSTEIVNFSNNNLLITKNEIIKLECKIFENKQDNDEDSVEKVEFKPSSIDYEIKYQWYKDDYVDENKLEGYTSSKIEIRDSGASLPENEDPKITYEMNSSFINLLCEVKIYKGKDENNNWIFLSTEKIDLTNPTTINSVVNANSTINSSNQYKYYLSPKNNLSFSKKNETIDDKVQWTGDWNISDNGQWVDGSNYEDIFINTNIFNNIDQNVDWYIYYTQRSIWTETVGGISTIKRIDDWMYPIIARQVSYINGIWVNRKDGASADQLNTFNQLTQGGSAQGIYYEDMGEAVNTKDTASGHPKADTKYYEKIISNGSIDYEPIELDITWNFDENKQTEEEKIDTEGTWYYYIKNNETYSRVLANDTFNSDITYYKKVVKKYVNEEDGDAIYKDSYVELSLSTINFTATEVTWPSNPPDTVYINLKENLFINASYINTGILRVGEENNEIFYADINKKSVKIAGFTVDKDSLQSGNENDNDYVYLGTDGLQVGKFLSVKEGSANFSGSISIANDPYTNPIMGVEIYYGLFDSATDDPDIDSEDWVSSVPQWQPGKYTWQKTVTTYLKEVPKEETISTYNTRATLSNQVITMACIQGSNGKDAITCLIDSSAGTSFPTTINEDETTILTAYLYQGSEELDPIEENKTNYFTYSWYYGDGKDLEYLDVWDDINGNGEIDEDESVSFPKYNGKQIVVKISYLKDKNIYIVATDSSSGESSILALARLGSMRLGV